MSILRSKHSGWTFEGRRTPFGGGGKGGGGGGGQQQTTAQSNQYANLSPWAQPYVTSLLGAAQQQVFQTKQNPATEGYWTDSAGNKVDAATAQADQGFHFGGGGGQQYNYNAGNPASTEITGINPYNAYGAYNPATGGQYGMTPSAQMAANAAVAGLAVVLWIQLDKQLLMAATALTTAIQAQQCQVIMGQWALKLVLKMLIYLIYMVARAFKLVNNMQDNLACMVVLVQCKVNKAQLLVKV